MRHGHGLRKPQPHSSHRIACSATWRVDASPRDHQHHAAQGEGAAPHRRAPDHAGKAPTLANRRLAFNRLRDREIVGKLFDELVRACQAQRRLSQHPQERIPQRRQCADGAGHAMDQPERNAEASRRKRRRSPKPEAFSQPRKGRSRTGFFFRSADSAYSGPSGYMGPGGASARTTAGCDLRKRPRRTGWICDFEASRLAAISLCVLATLAGTAASSGLPRRLPGPRRFLYPAVSAPRCASGLRPGEFARAQKNAPRVKRLRGRRPLKSKPCRRSIHTSTASRS